MSARTMIYVRVRDDVRENNGRFTCEPDATLFFRAPKGALLVGNSIISAGEAMSSY